MSVISLAWGHPTTAGMTRYASTAEMACMRPHTPSALNAQPIPACLAPTKHHVWPRQILSVQHAQTHHWKGILHGLMSVCSHVQTVFTTVRAGKNVWHATGLNASLDPTQSNAPMKSTTPHALHAPTPPKDQDLHGLKTAPTNATKTFTSAPP